MYISENCKWTPYGTDPELDKKVDYSTYYGYRLEAAQQGYGLDKLINDEDKRVRSEVAYQGYGLDKLVNDEEWVVRHEVALHGYGLDKLICEKYKVYNVCDISDIVSKYLKDNGYKSIFEWAETNPDKVVTDLNIDEWLNSNDVHKRASVLEHGYGLDKLIYDENMGIRYHVDKYLKDNGYKSIFEWAEANPDKVVTNIDIDEWLNSDNKFKRAEVAKHGYGLDKLVNDEEWVVRHEVAEQGYGLDKLINDKDWEIRVTVASYLKDHGYKSIEDWAKANPDKIYNKEIVDIIDKDFIYKVDDSTKLKLETSYNSIEEFFNDTSYESNESLTILTADTKIPLIKLEKTNKNGKNCYKFLVNITNEDDDNFIIKSIISSKEKFNQLLESTINALKEYPQFSKYAEDLENCL